MPPDTSVDDVLRASAFAKARRLMDEKGQLTSVDLNSGFEVDGVRIPWINPQRGIFKPARMTRLLSIKTVIPRAGARVRYDDQIRAHQQIYEGDEVVDYSFMGTDPDAAENRWLREAMEARVPIVYFLGTAPGLYHAIVPAYIEGFDARGLRAQVAFGLPNEASIEYPTSSGERRYALRDVKHRLHQASFREVVIAAYRGRCALSGLPEPLLLDAAHIVADRDELYGQPIVQNGIPLSKIHHAAFDAQLIGIDPDYRIHVADRLLRLNDGPTLEALKSLHRAKLHLPRRVQDRPDRDRLAMRFEKFRQAT